MHAYRGESRCNAESEFQGSCQVSPNFEVGEATNRTDVRLAWTEENERWGAAAFLTNVFDERYVTGVNNLTRDYVRHAVRVDLRAPHVGPGGVRSF